VAYSFRPCSTCGDKFQPRDNAASERGTCWPCHAKSRYGTAAPARRACEVCTSAFVVPEKDADQLRCASCRRISSRPPAENPFSGYEGGPELPREDTHSLAPPLKQAVFDLETWGLDRGWGVTMVGSILTFGAGPPQMHTFDLRSSSTWPHKRSDDAELGAKILKVLADADVVYAHNGARFDIPWLASVSLKYGLPPLGSKKLIDPVQVARKAYRIGRNSLAALADFLGLEEQKMPVSIQTWRAALLDNDTEAWETLRQRCESDVRVLANVAGKVTRDVGLIDFAGSAPRR
jgi:hypothetical protein